jgi:hypothetical protein
MEMLGKKDNIDNIQSMKLTTCLFVLALRSDAARQQQELTKVNLLLKRKKNNPEEE